MIARLRGVVVQRDPDCAIIEVGGVGYQVFATQRDLHAWASEDDEVVVHVSTQVREDDISLYGFATPEDRAAFRILLGVAGVGPKVALASLDALPLGDLRRAVETDDLHALGRISGVGKKTAQRLALELKGKLPAGFEPDAPTSPSVPEPARGRDPLSLALQRLGYHRAEIERVRSGLTDAGVPDSAPVAERLRAALKILYKQ